MSKIIKDSTLVGRQGVALVEIIVSKMKHVWNPTTVDSGIDGVIEFRDPQTGAMTNTIVQVQIKTGDSYFRAETDQEFTFYADPEDLEHWQGSNTPVILILCRPDRDIYWIDVKREDGIDRGGKKAKIRFLKSASQFTIECEPQLRSLAITKPWGFHLQPKTKKEVLTLNFMPVTFPVNRLYIAETDARKPRQVVDAVLDAGGKRWDIDNFVLGNEKIYALANLRDPIFSRACDQATIESTNLTEWLDEEPALGRSLMHGMLESICYNHFVAWRGREEVFFFEPTENGEPKTFRVEAKRLSYQTVYKQYLSKKVPGKISYHRHQAFEFQLQQFDAKWHLAITPTYIFTSDGWKTHPYHEDYLKKINEIEGPPAIFSRLKLWASVLQPIQDLCASNYPHMALGPPLKFELERGIDDKSWKPTAPDDDDDSAPSETAELGLEI